MKTAKPSLSFIRGMIITSFFACMTGLSAQIPELLELKINEQSTVTFSEDVRSATPSDPSVVSLQGIGQRQLVIRGVGNGKATIQYELRNDSKGTIRVQVGEGPVLPAIKSWVDRQLRGVVGVETRIDPTLKVVEIQGTVMLGESFDKIKDVMEKANRQWPRQVINTVEFKPDENFAEEVLLEYLKENNITAPVVNLDNRRLRLNGMALSNEDARRVGDNVPRVVEQLRLGDVIIDNQIRVNESTIEMEMTFFQMSESVVEELGMDLLNNLGFDIKGAAAWGSGTEPQYSAVVNLELSKVLNMLEEDGQVESIHSTTVTTANGEEGSSQFGETLVIVKRGADDDAVEEIEVGHIMKVTPRLLANNMVSLKMDGQVSEITSIDTDSNVRVNKNAFNNTMIVPIGSGIVAAFHKTDREIEVSSGTPGLRRIPIVNLVFGKKRYEKMTYYRGFVITPRVKQQQVDLGPSVSEQTEAIIKRIREREKK